MSRDRIVCSSLLVAALLALVVGCGKPSTASAAAAAPTPAATPPEPAPVEVVEPAPDSPSEPVAATAPDAETVSEKWYSMHEDGQQSGWLHVVWTRSTFEDRPTIHDHTERFSRQTRQMGHTEDRFEVASRTDLERTDDGLVLVLHTVTSESGRITATEMRWNGAGYDLTTTVGDVVERHSLACKEPVPVDSEAFLASRVRAGEVKVGDTLSYAAPNFAAERMETVDLVVTGREMLTLPTGSADCLRVEEQMRGRPGKVEMWLDDEGVVRRYVVASTTILHTTEQRARAVPVDGVSYSITVDARPFTPRATSFDAAVVDVTVPTRGGHELPDFPETPFSKEIGRDGDTIHVRLSAHDDPTATVALPVTDPALERWLRPTLLECADHPSVKAAMREAVGDVTDGREVAKRLLRRVFELLQKGSGPVASPNAAEILRDRMGDCSEHAVLFTALCRAAGLPCRRLSGYAMVGDMWGAHSFCEVWLGHWIGADPTTNELGTRARYIAFGWADDPDSYPGIVSQRMRGRARIRTVSFEEAGQKYDVADLTDGARSDPLAGLELAKPPEGWTVRIGPRTGSALLSGPDVRASVRVAAGMGDLPADLIAAQFYGVPAAVGEFAGRSAVVQRFEHRKGTHVEIALPYRRRLMMLDVNVGEGGDADAALEVIATLIAPSL